MIVFFRRLWHAIFPSEYATLPAGDPRREAYDLRGEAREIVKDAEGGIIPQSRAQLKSGEHFARFVLAVQRACAPDASSGAVARKAVHVWYGLDDLE